MIVTRTKNDLSIRDDTNGGMRLQHQMERAHRRIVIPGRVTVATRRCLMGAERIMPVQRKRM